jgi:hypothetical protein
MGSYGPRTRSAAILSSQGLLENHERKRSPRPSVKPHLHTQITTKPHDLTYVPFHPVPQGQYPMQLRLAGDKQLYKDSYLRLKDEFWITEGGLQTSIAWVPPFGDTGLEKLLRLLEQKTKTEEEAQETRQKAYADSLSSLDLLMYKSAKSKEPGKEQQAKEKLAKEKLEQEHAARESLAKWKLEEDEMAKRKATKMTLERAKQIIKDFMRPKYMALMDRKDDLNRRADELDEMRERFASERRAWERQLEELTEEMLALEFEV